MLKRIRTKKGPKILFLEQKNFIKSIAGKELKPDFSASPESLPVSYVFVSEYTLRKL